MLPSEAERLPPGKLALSLNNFCMYCGERMMERKVDRIAIGTSFKINQFGASRCPSLAGKTGIVIDCSRYNTGVTVLLDGSKRPTCLHRDYISPTFEWRQDAQRQPGEDNRLDGVPKSERRAL
jgi:hypothetical protein